MNKLAPILLALAASVPWAAGQTMTVRTLHVGPDKREDLVEHMVNQLSSRTNGKTWNMRGYMNLANFFFGLPTNVPDFWLTGVTNINGQNAANITEGGWIGGYYYMHPITPRFCVASGHNSQVPNGNPDDHHRMIWLMPDGTYYTNPAIGAHSSLGVPPGDMRLFLMEKTNPIVFKVASIGRNKIRRFQLGEGMNFPTVAFHQGCFGRTNPFVGSFIFSSSSSINEYDLWPDLNRTLRWGDYQPQLETPEVTHGFTSGDSGGALYAIVKNEAYLIGYVQNNHGANLTLSESPDYLQGLIDYMCETNGIPTERVTYEYFGDFKSYNQ